MTTEKKYLDPELLKIYRFEGGSSYNYFNLSEIDKLKVFSNYIYFSKSQKHHFYYVARRIKSIIDQEILIGTGLTIKKSVVLQPDNFCQIIKLIKNYPLDKRIVSIEFSTSLLMEKLLLNNCTLRHLKNKGANYIERVDTKSFQGGYGFCAEWLMVLEYLTYFYSYQRITREDFVQFVYNFRQNIINQNEKINTVRFLEDLAKRSVKLNDKTMNNNSKYELMKALEMIVEKHLYFPDSFIAFNPKERIKEVIKIYDEEKNRLLELQNEAVQRRLIRE